MVYIQRPVVSYYYKIKAFYCKPKFPLVECELKEKWRWKMSRSAAIYLSKCFFTLYKGYVNIFPLM